MHVIRVKTRPEFTVVPLNWAFIFIFPMLIGYPVSEPDWLICLGYGPAFNEKTMS